LVLLVGLTACEKPEATLTECGETPNLAVEAKAGQLTEEGAVTVYGTARFAPQVQSTDSGIVTVNDGGVPTERAVHDVYVGGARVTQHDFNFRSWTVTLDASRLCALAVSGESRAALDVRAYVAGPAGVCVYELPERVDVVLPSGACGADGGVDAGADAGP
jgi:hypothetical protein